MNYRSSALALMPTVQRLDIVERQRSPGIVPPWLRPAQGSFVSIVNAVGYALGEIARAFTCGIPWAVVGQGDVGTVVVHFVNPITPEIAPHIIDGLDEFARLYLPVHLRLEVTDRRPLCTIHPDCWEAGEEMPRDCFATAPATTRAGE